MGDIFTEIVEELAQGQMLKKSKIFVKKILKITRLNSRDKREKLLHSSVSTSHSCIKRTSTFKLSSLVCD